MPFKVLVVYAVSTYPAGRFPFKSLTLLAGLILAPYMADYGGRKKTILIGCFIVVVAAVVQCLSVNIHMFTGARFLSKLLLVASASCTCLEPD